MEIDELHLQKVTGILPAGTPVLVRMSGSANTGNAFTLSLTATNSVIYVENMLTATTTDGLSLTGAYSKKVLASAEQSAVSAW